MNFFPIIGWDVFPYGNLTISIYCIFVTYAILKYRLMDIRVAITRFAIFAVVYTLVLGVPFGIGYMMLGKGLWVVPLAIATFLATTGPFLYQYFQHRAEQRLLKEQKHYQNTLLNASKGMTLIKDLNKLIKLIVHIVTKTVRIDYAAIYLYDNETARYCLKNKRGKTEGEPIDGFSKEAAIIKYLIREKQPLVGETITQELQQNPTWELNDLDIQLKQLKANLIIPAIVQETLLGFLVLGKKKNKQLYTEDDIAVFSILGNEAALAIENAEFYEELEQTRARQFHSQRLTSLGQMASGMGHQIKNRLNVLSVVAGEMLYGDMLENLNKNSLPAEEKGKIIDKLKEKLKIIEEEAAKGGEIITRLSQYSKPSNQGLKRVHIKDIINESLSMVRYKKDISTIAIDIRSEDGLPAVVVDSAVMQDVFFNLIDNADDAIKAKIEEIKQGNLKESSYKGKIAITARKENSFLKIEVADNGIGVSEKELAQLFVPFFTTKATAEKGTGLGLFIIRKMVEFHKGMIIPWSIYGKGTKFTIQLPIDV